MLQKHSAHVLALSEGALPGERTVPGFVKYVSPSVPTFPHGSAAVYEAKDIPQRHIDSSSLCSPEVECAMVRVRTGGRSITIASIYVTATRTSSQRGLLAGIAKLEVGELIVCGDFNVHNAV